MKTLNSFKEHNKFVGLPEPKNEDIDIGSYDNHELRLTGDPVQIDFYRICYKSNFIDKKAPDYDPENPQPVSGMFFYSPEHRLKAWDIKEQFNGYYLQLSKDIINRHRYLFQNYMEYGEHEVLYLTGSEAKEVKDIFNSLNRHYNENPENTDVLISYIHVLATLIESFYRRQFSTDIQKYNRIVTEFQQLVQVYYSQEVTQIPTVQHFAEKLHLSPNYLGDIIKYHTERTAIETIHDHIIQKAKELLRNNHSNMSQIAYELGFEYPNNFSKFFKNHTELTPSEFRKNHKNINSKA
jgi:AraC family transcriptional regulator, transcriptional activator of pobA